VDHRPRRDLPDGHGVEELGVGQPVVLVDQPSRATSPTTALTER